MAELIEIKNFDGNDVEAGYIAHMYLKEMGYADDGQPLLAYAHHDTDNNHIHIKTSRIAPYGHKIKHNFEKRRSL